MKFKWKLLIQNLSFTSTPPHIFEGQRVTLYCRSLWPRVNRKGKEGVYVPGGRFCGHPIRREQCSGIVHYFQNCKYPYPDFTDRFSCFLRLNGLMWDLSQFGYAQRCMLTLSKRACFLINSWLFLIKRCPNNRPKTVSIADLKLWRLHLFFSVIQITLKLLILNWLGFSIDSIGKEHW